jgi:hypothetical protein
MFQSMILSVVVESSLLCGFLHFLGVSCNSNLMV